MNNFRFNKYNNCSCKNFNNCSKHCNNVPFNFHEKKENIVCSLNEVECFLCNIRKSFKML